MGKVKDIDYRAIIRKMPDQYVILTKHLKIVDATDAYLKVAMVERDDIIGKHILDVFPENPDIDSASGHINFLASIKIILEQKISHHMPIIHHDIRRPICEGGGFEERYWSINNHPVILKNKHVKYIIVRVENVTDMVKLKESELEKNLQLKMLMDNIKDSAVIMLDEKGYFTGWNVGAEAMMGYTFEEIRGKHFSDLYTKDSRDQNYPDAVIEAVRTSGYYEENGWLIRKNGSRFWSKSLITAIYDSKEHFTGFSVIIQDITLDNQIDNLKNEIVSIVNHELRTPLTSIFGSIKLILGWGGSNSSELKTKLLEIAGTNCDYLIQLINDVFDIDQLANEKIKFNLKMHDLTEIVKKSVDMSKFYADSCKVTLDCTPLSTSINVNVDASRLIRVLNHLLSNAIKFSSINSRVMIALKKQKDTVRVSIINKGEEIPEDFKIHMFERFSLADLSTTRKKRGKGLGLAICRTILEGLGTELKYKSKKNKETEFYFDLTPLNT